MRKILIFIRNEACFLKMFSYRIADGPCACFRRLYHQKLGNGASLFFSDH